MNKVICAIILMLALAGCSHNVVTYSDGIGLETTMRPDSGNFGLTFRYGKILNVTARENTEVKMNGEGSSDGSTGSVGTTASGDVHIKIGKQWNGYLKDAIKEGATPEMIQAYFGDTDNKSSVATDNTGGK